MITRMISEHFRLSEFRCKCYQCVIPQSAIVNIEELVTVYLQPLRDALGIPIHITSGYRCRDHNRSVGGVRDSQHLLGHAADIRVGSMSPQAVYDKVLELWPQVPGLGLYKSFVHIDNRNLDYRRGRPARW